MTVIEIINPEGQIEKFVEEEGWVLMEAIANFLPNGDLKAQLQSLKDLEIRHDDVYIVTYQKAGTHWIWELVSMLLKGSANYETKPKQLTMLDYETPENLGKATSPRVLNSHHPVHLTPRQILEKRTKIIHVSRNPKDIAVSLYNMIKKTHSTEDTRFYTSFGNSLRLFTGECGVYQFYPWYKFVLEWEQFTKDNPDQILNLSFEDMKEDTTREVRKLANFLDLKADDNFIQAVSDACSFQNLSKASDTISQKDPTRQYTQDGKSAIFRKGEVGDWKNWFTVAENERFDKWLSQHLTETDLKIRYEL